MLATRRTTSDVEIASRLRQRGIVDANIDAAERNDGSLEGGAKSVHVATVGTDLHAYLRAGKGDDG